MRRLSEDQENKPNNNATFTKKREEKIVTNNTYTKELEVETVSRSSAPSFPDSEISFNTPTKNETVVVGKSKHAAADRRKTYKVPSPVDVNLIKNSTRRSSLVFTPELMKNAKRPSNILPRSGTPLPRPSTPLTPQQEKLIMKYSNVVTSDTPRRRSKQGRMSSAPCTPLFRMAFSRQMCPKTEPPKYTWRTPQVLLSNFILK